MNENESRVVTPAAWIDEARLHKSCDAMRARLQGSGVTLRPHVKTHKCVEVARLQLGAERGPITVSTLREAEFFADAGFDDITYAVGILPARLPRVHALIGRGVRLTLLTDEPDVAAALALYASEHAIQLRVAIEVDVGQGRGGVPVETEPLLQIARALAASSHVEVAGVLAHAGHSYHAASVNEIVQIAEQERAMATKAAGRLREAGFAAPVVSIGSTPTITHGRSLEGVTEVRPGVYAFQDRFQAALGSCELEDLALSIATRVLHVRTDGSLLVDAGSLALSSDRPDASRGVRGFGDVRGPALEVLPGSPIVTGINQEHGTVRFDLGAAAHGLQPGALLRILPNHACTSAAAYDAYEVVDSHGRSTARWQRTGGW